MKRRHSSSLSVMCCTIALTAACLAVSPFAQAQRHGGGGHGGGGGGARSAPSGGGGAARNQPRAESRSSVNTANRNNNVNRNENVNRNNNVNANRNVNVNQNVNVNRDVHVDVDNGWDNNGWNHHPVATAAAVTATVAVTAAVVGSVVNSVPPSCTTVIQNGVTYSQCGSTWYQPSYQGSQVSYVVVNPPY
jgi:hypothetical protein